LSERTSIHGTRLDPASHHRVLDLAHWEAAFPIANGQPRLGSIDGAVDLARREQACRVAQAKGDLGPSVPVDAFVWTRSDSDEPSWLTRLGGAPWREKGKPWPKDDDGIPLMFLGQICFKDSHDILTHKLPGDVALIFGAWSEGNAWLENGSALEWSKLDLKDPETGLGSTIPWNGRLPFAYDGVRHRTLQYTEWDVSERPFEAAGWKYGSHSIGTMQATQIGTYVGLPQGWPYTEGDGNTLIATLSSFYFRDPWPLCDVPRTTCSVTRDGREFADLWNSPMSFAVGDAGAIWIVRDRKGRYFLDSACG